MGELYVHKSVWKHIVALLLLFGILGLPPALRSFEGSQASGERKIDYASAQQGILKFEALVDNVINSTFSSTPFALVQKTKGAYLEGYGLSFAFLVDIHRAMLNTPFGQIKRAAATSPELKKQRIDELREHLIKALQENGESFRRLRKEDCVTIIAFIEDRNFPDEPNANKTIILTALKKDIDEFGHQQERFQDFKKRIKIVEY
jgi:hypothetical protein